MDSLFENYKRTGYLHHAHLIQGTHEDVMPALTHLLEKHMGVHAHNNPDVTFLSLRTFGIDESRNLSEMQTRASFSSSKGESDIARKFFIVGTDSITREAQTALLKTFEEPTVGTHFFFVVPRADTILATLKSRVVFFDAQDFSEKKKEEGAIAEKFLQSTRSERFAMIKKITETKKDVPINREMVRIILDHLERILYTRLAGKKDTTSIFHEIYQAKNYLADRGSSPKMLLEHLAIVVPEFN
ncbi:MAG: hypothetical protein A3B07_01575 [Candidatus Yonathbacteria bacterium RIFCSPLOWO2_01_FULL_43_27]|uniref:Uncharacterized protein n=1 Tax=Candidatus Yonathbacteria bacterium RIFCSPLOWO2_01_FULL_43_27 TaxID=1802726 RepID=A0A1G2SC36_9BACT|nr:MAG: hypothetical protein A2658_01370 [Candidatus Yonathbacteria bacterium RIFCSPHIGHO2_01_FULL_44_19]OHA82604.1 MAG: hypothetical protein A3B07_01575 [Candidatus Yonathbacteria bacterium RIFCSPLOWO2_01_FULL_43_27]